MFQVQTAPVMVQLRPLEYLPKRGLKHGFLRNKSKTKYLKETPFPLCEAARRRIAIRKKTANADSKSKFTNDSPFLLFFFLIGTTSKGICILTNLLRNKSRTRSSYDVIVCDVITQVICRQRNHENLLITFFGQLLFQNRL